MALFTALSSIAALGGAVSAAQDRRKAERQARRDAKAQEDKAREAAALRGPQEQEVRTKIGVGDAEKPTTTNSERRGTATRQADTGLGGMAVSAATIGGL